MRRRMRIILFNLNRNWWFAFLRAVSSERLRRHESSSVFQIVEANHETCFWHSLWYMFCSRWLNWRLRLYTRVKSTRSLNVFRVVNFVRSVCIYCRKLIIIEIFVSSRSLIFSKWISSPLFILRVKLMYLHFIESLAMILSRWPFEYTTIESFLYLSKRKYFLTTLRKDLFTWNVFI